MNNRKNKQELLPDFYTIKPLQLAKELLGKLMEVKTKQGLKSAIILETEAYVGTDDLACHASKGRTERNRIMWEVGGHAYVYLIYGMYNMFNIIAGPEGFPAGILVRAAFPYKNIGSPLNGPGKLARELEITRQDSGIYLPSNPRIRLFDIGLTPSDIHTSPRIGIDYAGVWAHKPWRFYIDENHLSE